MKQLLIAAAVAHARRLQRAELRAAEPTIPIIVKDTTSFYWQIVLAGARKAGKDLGVNVPELGAQSESPTSTARFRSSRTPSPKSRRRSSSRRPNSRRSASRSTRRRRRCRSSASIPPPNSKAFTSFLTTDNVQGGRIAADGLADGDQGEIRQGRGRRRADHLAARASVRSTSAPRASRRRSRPNIPASSSSPTRSPTARRRPLSTS